MVFAALGRGALRQLLKLFIGGLSTGQNGNAAKKEAQRTKNLKGKLGDAVEPVTYESARRYRTLVQNTSDIITLIGADGTVHYESSALERVMGYRPEDQIGTNAFDWVHPDDVERALDIFAEIVSTPGLHSPIEFRAPHKDGSWRYLEHTVNNLLDDPDVRGIVVTSRDITERKELEDQLRHQAFHDRLTELPNRALFTDRLEHALARAGSKERRLAVLFIDLNNFKLVNDSLGHEMGDRLLVAVAKRLEGCLRPGDTVARLGGDEFAILIEDDVDEAYARRVAVQIAQELKPPFVLGQHEVFSTPSIGIALSSSAKERPEDLLRLADIEMYRAKNNGWVYSVVAGWGTSEQALRRLELEGDLRRAVEREEFRVFYQPEILLEDGKIVGMEALVRWEHPRRGLVLPSEFIAVAEGTGLIFALGKQVLEVSCRQARAWRERCPWASGLVVWVNLSAKQFQRPRLVDEVAEALKKTGLPPSGLGLEITESVAMEDAPVADRTLRRLAGLGVHLAIDDFGTGYSSLSYLSRFPVELLKIDRSFVKGLGEDPEVRVILSAMISLAHDVGMKAIAEGVETAEELARLRRMGCDMVQGYYFSEPLPFEDASALVTASFQ